MTVIRTQPCLLITLQSLVPALNTISATLIKYQAVYDAASLYIVQKIQYTYLLSIFSFVDFVNTF